MAGKVVVIGLGNVLRRDDGVGIHSIRELKRRDLPGEVEVIDGGLAGIGLLDLIREAGKAVIIDAADMDLPRGSVVRFTPGEIRSRENPVPRFSAHEIGLLEVLEMAEALGQSPREVVIIGVQPKEISWGMELTPEVAASLPEIMDLIFNEFATEDTDPQKSVEV